MSTNSFQRSQCQSFVRSPCQARLRYSPIPGNAVCILGIIPVWGFGTFAGATAPGLLTYNDDWPFVYSTLTETWTQSDGAAQETVSTWSQYVDLNLQVVTTTTGGGIGTFGVTSIVVTSTLVTINYTSGGTVTGIYTAQITGGPWNPNDGADGWLARALAADGLMAKMDFSDVTIFSLPGNSACVSIAPISTAPYWGGSAYDGSYFGSFTGRLWAAAAYGMGLRSSLVFGVPTNYVQNILGGLILPANISDYTFALDATDPIPNQGGIISMKSIWNINGSNPSPNPPFGPFVANNHRSIYAEPLVVDATTGVPSLGTVALPSPLILSKPPSSLSQPVAVPNQYTFTSADVLANIPAGKLYGMMGFRSSNA